MFNNLHQNDDDTNKQAPEKHAVSPRVSLSQ